MNDLALSAKGIVREFRENGQILRILDGLDLDVRKGEIVAILGVSGSGKSTLLSILGTLDRPDSGTMLLGGRDPFKLSDRELSRLRANELGFMFQFHHLLPDLSALENVQLAARIAGVGFAEAAERAKDLLAQVGLSQRETHRPGQLSGGERQRVALARALANRPSLVLADEPTGNLDPHNCRVLLDMLLDLAHAHQQAFLLATHDPNLASGADRRLRIVDGRLEEVA
ncbi:MAG: ABC transporter ATP-binding protein [Fibrobacterota bacterium]|nr:ABC transporter ATP-binding protein [Fibrobacterota bacterium]QQS04133.1 MAG: ABC transporter ATP-binding protein [Fibrobacterota bacterium]